LTDKKIAKIHKHSSKNRQKLSKSQKCGCFYCGTIFNSVEITDWLEDIDGDEAANCPYCWINSVIGESSGYSIKSELLKELSIHYFNGYGYIDTGKKEIEKENVLAQ